MIFNHRRVLLASVLLLLSLVPAARAQKTEEARKIEADKFYISLDEAISRAEDESYLTRKANLDQQVAHAGVVSSRAAYLPQVSVSNTAYSTTDPLNVFGFKLKEQNVIASDFSPAALNNPDRIDHFATRVDIQQPIFNPEGHFRSRAAGSRLQSAVFGEQRARYTVSFMVREAYFALVVARRRVEVLDSTLTIARNNQEEVEHLFREGLINRADLLEVRVHVLDVETSLTEARDGVKTASERLRYQLGMDTPVELVPTDGLEEDARQPSTIDMDRINTDRSDMQALAFQRDAARKVLKASQTSLLPSLSVFGSYEWNDNSLLGSQGTNWGLGAVLKWNLFSGFQRKGEIERARAQVAASELALSDTANRNRIEVDQTLRAIATTQKRIELANASVAHAVESLRIRTDRYAEGLEKTTDVLNAEVLLSTKRLALLDARYRHAMMRYRLEFLTENMFIAN